MPTRAVLFDLDGTLVHNMPFHVQAWMALCRAHGFQATETQFERDFAGMKNEELLPRISSRPLSPEELESLAREKEETYRRLYAPHLSLIAGARELIDRLRAAGIRLAIASAAPPANRDFVLGGLSLVPLFDAVVGAEQAKRGKPFPDLFLAAAQAIGVAAGDCVVFEDAVNGVRAAKAAGMPAIGLSTTASPEALREAGALTVLRDFTALPEEVESLLFRSRAP